MVYSMVEELIKDKLVEVYNSKHENKVDSDSVYTINYSCLRSGILAFMEVITDENELYKLVYNNTSQELKITEYSTNDDNKYKFDIEYDYSRSKKK